MSTINKFLLWDARMKSKYVKITKTFSRLLNVLFEKDFPEIKPISNQLYDSIKDDLINKLRKQDISFVCSMNIDFIPPKNLNKNNSSKWNTNIINKPFANILKNIKLETFSRNDYVIYFSFKYKAWGNAYFYIWLLDSAWYVNKSSWEVVFTNKEEFYNYIDDVIFKNIHDISWSLADMKIMIFKKSGWKTSWWNLNNIDSILKLAA